MVRLLLASDADVKLRDADGFSAMAIGMAAIPFPQSCSFSDPDVSLFVSIFNQAQIQSFRAFCNRVPHITKVHCPNLNLFLK